MTVTAVTSRSCAARAGPATASGASAGMPAARPFTLSSRAAATGALTWSSAAMAASTACGHCARWASRARSRSACGAYSRS